MAALLCCQLVFAAPVSSFGAERLTVSAVSNIFDSFFASFDAATERITVTYFVQSSEWKILNAQWTLTYDPEYLELDDAEDVNYTIDDDVAIGYMMPFAGDDGVYNIDDPGAVVANTSKLNGYRIKEKDGSKVGFVSATFKPLKAGSTVVSLDAEVVTLKKGGTEIKVVDGSRITDETISFIPEKT